MENNLLLTDEEIKVTVKNAPVNERGLLDIDRSIAKAQLEKCEKAIEQAKQEERERIFAELEKHRVTVTNSDIGVGDLILMDYSDFEALKESK